MMMKREELKEELERRRKRHEEEVKEMEAERKMDLKKSVGVFLKLS